MTRLLLLTLLAATGAARSEAMPVGRVGGASLSITVASGCGLGVRRGPLDGCEPIYGWYYPGYGRGVRNDYNNYYVGFGRGGFCGGRGTHLACDFYGNCWVACN